jgi:tRNA uridine 5-carboxymethylaminomethyl modification enzyme
MFTSRAEFRLHLRIDNADRRLTPHGRRVGLISDQAWADFQAKQERLAQMKKLMDATRTTPEMLAAIEKATDKAMDNQSTDNLHRGTAASGAPAEPSPAGFSSGLGQTLAQLLKRPEVTIEQLAPALGQLSPEFFARDPSRSSEVSLSSDVRNELKSVETEIKYEGYLLQQQRAMERLRKSEQHAIPEWFDYKSVSGLSREMQEKLTKVRPRTIGQASRIPGVTPAAVSLVNVYIEIQSRRREQAGL